MLSNEYWLPREFREKTHDRFVVCYLALALDCAVPILDAYHHRCAPLRIHNYPGSILHDRVMRFMHWKLTGRANWRPDEGGWIDTKRGRGIYITHRDYKRAPEIWCQELVDPETNNRSNWLAWTLSDSLIESCYGIFAKFQREPLYASTVALQFENSLIELIRSCEQ